jgi:hypothetical protein
LQGFTQQSLGLTTDSLPKRKGARVDEWNGLENRQGCKPLGGSNPPPSAIKPLRRFAKSFQGVSDGVPKYLQTVFDGVDARNLVAIKGGDLYFGNSLT